MSKSPKHSEFKDQLGDFNPTPPSSGWEGVVGALPNSAGEFASVGSIPTPPPAHVWPEIAAVIAPKRKRRIAYWWWTGAAAAIFMGVLFNVDFSGGELQYRSMNQLSTIQEGALISENPDVENVEDGSIIARDEVADENLNEIITLVNNNAGKRDKSVTPTSSKDNKARGTGRVPRINNEDITAVLPRKDSIDFGINRPALNAIAYVEPRNIPAFIENKLSRRDYPIGCLPPPMPKVKFERETILAANVGATGRNNATSSGYTNEASSFQSADAAIYTPITSAAALYNVQTELIDYTQRVPINFGMDVKLKMGQRWYLSSGLNYTGTTGVVKYSVQSQIERYTVKDHFLGVPLTIGFDFLDRRKFNLFSSFSHLNELLVVRNQINSYPAKEKSAQIILQPQLGVGAELGILFKLKNNWGISSSISARKYYFAPVNSYWKSRNIWPSLKVSVVYNFHKKKLFK